MNSIRNALLAALAFYSASAASALADSEVIFSEGFSSFNYVWTSTASGAKIGDTGEASFDADNSGWKGEGVIKGKSGLRLGMASSFGKATTPSISFCGKGETTGVSVSFYAAAVHSNSVGKATIEVSVEGCEGVSKTFVMADGKLADKDALLDSNEALLATWEIADVSALPNPFKLKFTASGDGRSGIDKITIVETYSTLAALSSPTGFAAENVTTSGFTLSWNAVDSATGYAAQVLSGDTLLWESGVLPNSTTSVVVESDSIEPATTYSARVKAMGDRSLWNDSAWAETSVTTAAQAGLKEFSLFSENFSSVTAKWSGSSYLANDEGTFDADESGWTGVKVCKRPSCVSVGLVGTEGWLKSRVISLGNNCLTGNVTLSFVAATPTAAGSRKAVQVKATVFDAETDEIVATATADAPKLTSTADTVVLDPSGAGEGSLFTGRISSIPENFYVLFEVISPSATATGDRQFAIDAISFSQAWDPSISSLTPPVASFDQTQTTMSSLVAKWDAISGASGYAVELRDSTGQRVSFEPALSAESLQFVFSGLEWNSEYSVRVRALGDGSNSANSPWCQAVSAFTSENEDSPEWIIPEDAQGAIVAGSTKTFSVAARRNGAPVAVSFVGLDPVSSSTVPTFEEGVFSWTPSDADAGIHEAKFSTDNGKFSVSVSFEVRERPALVEPVISLVSAGITTASLSWDPEGQPRAVAWSYRLWRGSDSATDEGVMVEHMYHLALPAGWSGNNGSWQQSFDYRDTPVSFTEEGQFLQTKAFAKPVTHLEFLTRRPRKDNAPGLKLEASRGISQADSWTEIPLGDFDPDQTKTRFSLDFGADLGYRCFRWTYSHKDSNLNLGSFEFVFEGAGAKFAVGNASDSGFVAAPEGNELNLTGLRALTDYFIEVRVVQEDGLAKSAVLRFATKAAEVPTIIMLR